MKRIILFLFFVLLVSLASAFETSSSHNTLSVVIVNGVGSSRNGTYMLDGVVGESFVGELTSDKYRLSVGVLSGIDYARPPAEEESSSSGGAGGGSPAGCAEGYVKDKDEKCVLLDLTDADVLDEELVLEGPIERVIDSVGELGRKVYAPNPAVGVLASFFLAACFLFIINRHMVKKEKKKRRKEMDDE